MKAVSKDHAVQRKRSRWENRFQWAGVLARCAVGALFIYMGLTKALDPVGFLKLVRQYDLPLGYLLINWIAASLPWFEVFCGLLIFLGVAVRGTSLLMLGMLTPFTFIVIKRALELADLQRIAFCAVKFDCGCGGGEVFICAKVLENCLLAAAAVWLMTGWGRPLSLRYDLIGRNQTFGSATD